MKKKNETGVRRLRTCVYGIRDPTSVLHTAIGFSDICVVNKRIT